MEHEPLKPSPPAPLPKGERGDREAAYGLAVRVAAVAGVFCLLVVTLLFYHYSLRQAKDPGEATMLKALKADLAGQPENQALKEQIRILDLELRQKYMWQRAFAAGGAVLLLGGIVVLLAAATWAATLRRKLPLPQPLGSGRDRQAEWTPLARWAVAGVGVALAVAAAVLIARCGPLPWQATSQPKGTVPSSGQARRDESPPQILGQPPSAEEIARAWPRFRGPGGAGISAYANVSESWDGPSGKNILWKTPVPLPGNNSPVVWGNRVFLSGADAKHREVYCFDAADGRLLWQKEVPAGAGSSQSCKVRDDVGFASPTMATDGRLAAAVFANGDVAAFDFQGELIWSHSLGVPDNSYGHAASPVIFHDLLLIPMDQGHAGSQRSKLLALDVATGKTVWQQPRQTANTWSSPIVIHGAGRDQLITTGDPWVIAYELPGGGELWRAKCLYGEIGPSPVFANGLVYAAGSEDSPVAAIAPDGHGDVSKSKVLWKCDEGQPDLCSPLATERFLFLLASYGPLTCYDARQGKKLWQDDLEDKFQGHKISFRASPGLAGNRLYLISEEGRVVVVEADAAGCKGVGRGDLGEPCVTSPAFQDGRIYLRGQKHLFCVGKKVPSPDQPSVGARRGPG
ncbi:MAG: PQQ-binding-like beta-propeller repeat protein [Thermoguttaceae bacterium]